MNPAYASPQAAFLASWTLEPHAHVARSSSAGFYRENGRPGDHVPWEDQAQAAGQGGGEGPVRGSRGREVTPFPRGDPEFI